jgi:hypothetical protein
MKLKTVVKYISKPKIEAVVEHNGALRRIGYGWQKETDPNRLPECWYDAVMAEANWQSNTAIDSLEQIVE